METDPFLAPWVEGEALLSLIPQREPVVMVDRFYGLDEPFSYTGLTVGEANLFNRNGRFTEYGITEHIAQSAAVRIGYACMKRGEAVPVGFIGSVDKMDYYASPATGDELHTILKVEQEIFGLTLVSAKVYVKERLVAEGKMKIFLKKAL
ncbi:MAG: hydroxymyristoyl-ACP dehydratase [Tannerellaceae bacterium]|jgi:3-hydroxymyristoyl/3-hydroxydecanoyl-(acyl carrier protein) dehydratase|nr:hydroxymyristoyl-ACP dehydratase [Tannerellaceae bacterium]